ncbi:hypothetical protein [Natrinema salifodinae]|uniref:Uncharacterized protein n=1 Tax=Natrinema salifodinae TaxID=1202768 RepID=A0A1I0M5T0_9EURY|nr:hypothetical protein [Natrinema salifodinae]SEV82721.1 hypothetical protein SAMN05216285_0399 [Natrinema salifodinae]
MHRGVTLAIRDGRDSGPLANPSTDRSGVHYPSHYPTFDGAVATEQVIAP